MSGVAQSPNGYCPGAGKASGRWAGIGAQRLGLEGDVRRGRGMDRYAPARCAVDARPDVAEVHSQVRRRRPLGSRPVRSERHTTPEVLPPLGVDQALRAFDPTRSDRLPATRQR